jgi:O-6-methylguanine DNA methyltransferase
LVWRTALRIPYGRARSYHWIASKVGGRRYARAVGHALGANPLPLIVPCHRVVAHDASLGGFSGGLKTKRRLLELEGTLALLTSGKRRVARGER